MAMDFGLKKRIEGQYARLLMKLFDFINRSIVGLTVADAAKKILQVIESVEFERLAETAVLKMVTMVKAENERSWRAAAAKGSFAREVSRQLRNNLKSNRSMQTTINQIIADNARLIKTVPRETANRITAAIYEQYLKGLRLPSSQQIVIREAPWLTAAQARLIARTETAKANAAITEARSRDMGADWYIWRSSHDERVRSSHAHMDGVFVHWDTNPNPETLNGEKDRFGGYHAGCCPNCRCYAEPLIDSSQIAVKIRVFTRGQIRTMGRNQFLEMIGVHQLVA